MTRALHSNFFSKLSSRVSRWNEFSRVETSSEKARKTHSDPNFCKTAITETRENENRKKTQFFAKIRVGTSQVKFLRVGTSSEKARITRSSPNFRKTPITETRENENFGKSRLSQGLSGSSPDSRSSAVFLNQRVVEDF